MNLPRQVQAREEQANQAIERIKQGGESAQGPTDQAQQVVQQPPVDWEARYKTLQGKYNAEVPRLSELVRTQQEQIETLKRELEHMKSRPPVAADTRSDFTADLPEDLRDRFDPDLIQLVATVSAKQAEQIAARVEPVVESVREERNQRAEKLLTEQRRAEMLEALNELSPGWERIDATAEFAAYLNQLDPATGKPLKDTLTEAVQRFDAARAARIFNAYARTLPTTAAPQRPNLAAQQVPDLAGAGFSAPAGDKRIWTRAEIQAEAKRIALLSLKDPAAAKEREREIDLAMREGRIR